MAGGAGLFEDALAAWYVPFEIDSRLVLTDDFLPVGYLIREQGAGALLDLFEASESLDAQRSCQQGNNH